MENEFACLIRGSIGVGFLRSYFWPTLEEAINCANERPGVVAIQRLSDLELVWKRSNNNGEELSSGNAGASRGKERRSSSGEETQ